MRRKLLLILITAVFLLSIVLVGCQEGGIAKELYDKLGEQLNEAKLQLSEANSEVTNLQNQVNELQAQKDAAEAELKAAQDRIVELQGQMSGIEDQYNLEGATPAETAEKIVKYYHETHVYSSYDLFVCSDMASEVWNMLKAQEINALIMVGNKDTAISNILESNHAWVWAEVSPGEYLALETTGGFVVTGSKNPLYYRGWSFESPADLKSHNQLVREYNIRVVIRNQMADEANAVRDEYNQETNHILADQLAAVHDKLIELIETQEAEIEDIGASINNLANKCST
jgi:outer membrane murein-binding lipoprotein Lpp